MQIQSLKREQLIELYKTQLIPRIKSQIPNELKRKRYRNATDIRQEQDREQGGRSLKHILSWKCGILPNKIDEFVVFTGTHQELWGMHCVSPQHGFRTIYWAQWATTQLSNYTVKQGPSSIADKAMAVQERHHESIHLQNGAVLTGACRISSWYYCRFFVFLLRLFVLYIYFCTALCIFVPHNNEMLLQRTGHFL